MIAQVIDVTEDGIKYHGYSYDYYHKFVMLVDGVYWSANNNDLNEWLKLYNGIRNGNMISFRDEETFILFKLRWL